MKIKTILRSAALASAVALVAACGGSDDESGSLTSFNIVPDSISRSGFGCLNNLGETGARVFINGGTGPYTIQNTFPDLIQLDRDTVNSQGDYFTVWFLDGCVDPATIVVIDAHGRQAELTITDEP